MEEGCLSIPEYYTKVKRPARVEVEAFDESGQRVIIKADKLWITKAVTGPPAGWIVCLAVLKRR